MTIPENNLPLSPSLDLGKVYRDKSVKIRESFFVTGDGLETARRRSALVDEVLCRIYGECVSSSLSGPEDFCLVGLGGYGREELLPHSDVDLLLVYRTRVGNPVSRDQVGEFLRNLWDLDLNLGNSVRPLAECARYHPDNLEFSISLLDARYLAGDRTLFAQLEAEALPRLVSRQSVKLLRNLTQLTAERHRDYEDTIYHLEPNVKSAPGGLRDFQVACWISQILHLEEKRILRPGTELVARHSSEALNAQQFLFDVRTYLHYFVGRDQNTLTYARQEELAAKAAEGNGKQTRSPEDWMRAYFRQARVIYALLLSRRERASTTHSSLLSRLRKRRANLSLGHFEILRGKIYFQHSLSFDPELLFELFKVVARHGASLRPETEGWISGHLPLLSSVDRPLPNLWAHLKEILTARFAYDALFAMHSTGVLTALFPEFKPIDCLVIRDFYHRYTVDEHSLLTIKHLHVLGPKPEDKTRRRKVTKSSASAWEENFREIFLELSRPEILFFVLLFHDIGKGIDPDRHIATGMKVVERIMIRLQMEEEERILARFLIENHLEMSASLMRRDFSRDNVLRQFADRVATADRLKMLTLLTYVDIQSVNPDALTSWKQELLWQLYMATYNELTHTVDDDRYDAASAHPQIQTVVESLAGKADPTALKEFLKGFPWHYLRTHSAEEIHQHFQLARDLPRDRVESLLQQKGNWYSLLVMTADRPSLFAHLTGALAAFGMNILKADAFANRRGTILDSFVFEDPHRNFELNPSEVDRFRENLVKIIEGELDLKRLLSGRREGAAGKKSRRGIPTEIIFDNGASARATVMEIYTADRPALLHDIGRTLSTLGCNIEVALIDTEGGKAIDVFYLTRQNHKLGPATQRHVSAELRKILARTHS